MRRLIDWIYRTAFGLHTATLRQHIADLQRQLSDLCIEHDDLTEKLRAKSIEIDYAIDRLIEANSRLTAAQHKQPSITRCQQTGGETVTTC